MVQTRGRDRSVRPTGLAALAGIALVLVGVSGAGRAAERPASADAVIAFLRDGDVWTMREDGSEQVQLTHFGDVGYLAWSPDGKHIAFGRANAIWVMTDEGRRAHEVARTAYPGASGTLRVWADGAPGMGVGSGRFTSQSGCVTVRAGEIGALQHGRESREPDRVQDLAGKGRRTADGPDRGVAQAVLDGMDA